MILNDKHRYLIDMYKGLQNGYVLPDCVSKEQYEYVREHKEDDPVLTGFIGFGCSFGGKWFGGYATSKKEPNGVCEESKHSLTKQMCAMRDAEFVCADYKEVAIPDLSVVYADPPYECTTGYETGQFSSDEFWEYMRHLHKLGHRVFISEQSAPEDFSCIWQKDFLRTIDVNKANRKTVIEKLFTL